MKTYKIIWTETVQMQDFIDAESKDDALDKFHARSFAEHMHAEPLTEMLVKEGSLQVEELEDDDEESTEVN